MAKKTNKHQKRKSADTAALTAMALAVFIALSAANAAAQDAPDSPLKFTVNVTYMTQDGAKKTDSIAVLASSPSEAEREAEARFKAKNPRSTFIRAAAEFVPAKARHGINRPVVTDAPPPGPKPDSPPTGQPDSPLKFTACRPCKL